MSEHRYPCDARVPRLVPHGCGHRHSCLHDADDHPSRMIEHRCECGMTWTVRPGGAMSIEAERDLLGRQQQAVLNLCANAEATGRLIHHGQIYDLLTTDPGDQR